MRRTLWHKKIHISENGPGPCTAKPGNCPVGGEHFEGPHAWAEAGKAFDAKQGDTALQGLKKERTSNKAEDADVSSFIQKREKAGFQTYLRGNTIAEIKKNLKEDKKTLAKADRITSRAYEESLNNMVGKVALDHPEISQHSTVELNYHPTKPDKNSIIITTYPSVDADEDAKRSMRNTDYFSATLDYGEVIADNQNDEGDVTRSYDIPEEDLERLNNQNAYERVKRLNEIADNPNLPDWAVLPPQRQPLGSDKRLTATEKVALNKTSRELTDNFRAAAEKLNKYNLAEERNRKREEKIQDLQNKRKAFTKAIEGLSRSTGADLSQNVILKEDLENHVDKLNEEIDSVASTHKRNKIPAAKMKLVQSEYTKAQKALENFNKESEDRLKIRFISDLSRRYPSNDPAVREAEAEKWSNANPEAWKAYNNELFNP